MEKTSGFKVKFLHIILFLIALAAMNVINGYYYFVFIAFGFFCITPMRKIQIDVLSVSCLLVLALSILLTSPETTASVFGVFKPFTYLLCYIMGMSLLNNEDEYLEKNNFSKFFYALVAVIAIGSFAHYFLNWTINWSIGAPAPSADITRNTIDFWTRSTVSATGQAALACLALALAVACLFCDSGKPAKFAAGVAIVIVFAYNLILSGRTLFVLLFILVLIAFLHRMKMEKKGKLKQVLLIVLVIAAVILLFRLDFLGVRSYFEQSPLYERFFVEESSTGLTEDSRGERKLFYLQNMLDYPGGGAKMHDQVGYAHDIFLDTYDHYSVFALLAMIVFLANTVVHFVRCITDKTLPFVLRQIVLCVYMAVYLEFMVEPILMGMPWLFACFCLIDGYLSRILMSQKELQQKRVSSI